MHKRLNVLAAIVAGAVFAAPALYLPRGADAHLMTMRVGAAVTQKSLTFVADEAKTTTCTSPCTWSNGGAHFNIGNADSTRIVHAIYQYNAASAAFTSATICSVSATANANVQATSGNSRSIILSAAVPTGSGATCDVVTTSTSPLRGSVGVWYSLGYGTTTAQGVIQVNNCTSCTGSVTPTAGGYIISGAMQTTNGTAGSFSAGSPNSRWSNNLGSAASDWGADCTNCSGATTVTSGMGGGTASTDTMVSAAF